VWLERIVGSSKEDKDIRPKYYKVMTRTGEGSKKSGININGKQKGICSTPKVTIIVLNWNGRNLLKKCLDSVIKTNYPNFEVIVVDNASNDGSQSIIEKHYANVRLIENMKNIGYAGGNNVAIKCTEGDYVVLLNNDTIVYRDWISELIKIASTDYRIGILGCKVYVMGTNIIQHAGCELSFISKPFFTRSLEEDRGQYNEVSDVDYISGEAMMIKRDVFDKVGLLDLDYFAYWEDVDFCYRTRKAGYRIVYVPKSIIEHKISASWEKRPLEAKILGEKNRILFILKNLPYHRIIGLPILEIIHLSKRLVEGLSQMILARNPHVQAAVLGLSEKASTSMRLRVILDWPVALLYAYLWNIRFLRRTLSRRLKNEIKSTT